MEQEASSAPTTIPPQRHFFDIPAEVTYLNCANMAPQLRGVGAAGIAAVQARNAPWELSPEGWFAAAERLRGLFERIVNADAEGIALVPSVSYGMAIAAANVPVRRGQSIVLLDLEFPSGVYAWRTLAGRRDGRLRLINDVSGATWTEAVIDAIDGDTAVVVVPNCHWTDGREVDLGPWPRRLARWARPSWSTAASPSAHTRSTWPPFARTTS